MKKGLFVLFVLAGLMLSQTAHAGDTFIAKIGRLAVFNGDAYDGTEYLELTFQTPTSGTKNYTYYAIPLSEPAFAYMYAMLLNAKKEDLPIEVKTWNTFTRSDGTVFQYVGWVGYATN